jgi:hypothetical protein
MSDTPRTKAATRMAFTSEYMVEIEEAQKLERELAEVTKQRDALAEIYPLLASAWFYGEWIAETYNEREIQKIMERQGWWPFEYESDLMTALSATEGGCK